MTTSNLERPPLTSLTPSRVEVEDLSRFPKMTGWFAPGLLSKLLLRVVISDVFGQYADRRLINAALDTVAPEEHCRRADFSGRMTKDSDDAIWFDYVADLGDGFDATYAIAYLLAQPNLTLDGVPDGKPLPRGSLLVMGGDEVYPTALRDDYIAKMRLPYSYALPDTKPPARIPMLLLPGNHDWYDGLVNFLAMFCREKPTPIGAWRTSQRRSYFAAKLSDKWWIWGIDIALVRDMDQPQADYFVAIAKAMPHDSNIILCSAEPGWYKAETEGDAFRTLSYAAWIAENAEDEQGKEKNLKIPLVLSGDSHHYARYSGAGTHYITSGGGGAFVHGTLELKPEIRAKWLRDNNATLNLTSCYPTKEESSELLGASWKFGALNAGFTTLLASLYLIFASAYTVWPHWETLLFEFLILLAGLYGYSTFQEGRSSATIVIAAAVQALAHLLVAIGIAQLAWWIQAEYLSWFSWHWLLWTIYLAAFAFSIGRWLAGLIFGLTLMITCRYFDLNHNDAFSAMQLDSHRHFLRIRMLGDRLTIFPIKLDTVPKRHQWKRNTDPKGSVFVSDAPMEPGLVEPAIEIHGRMAPSTNEMKSPAELSKS